MIVLLFSLLLNSIAVFVTARVLPGVMIDSLGTSLVVAVLIGLLNTLIRPAIFALTLPVNILTMTLVTLILNTFVVVLAGKIVPGFFVHSYLYALLFALVLGIVNGFIHSFASYY
jgi:putative membrane protein